MSEGSTADQVTHRTGFQNLNVLAGTALRLHVSHMLGANNTARAAKAGEGRVHRAGDQPLRHANMSSARDLPAKILAPQAASAGHQAPRRI